MPSVKANGIEIAYELCGSGPTLALSHGWTNPTRFWRPAIVEELARHLRVLIYDVRGHGDTTAPDDLGAYSMPIYAQDLRALMDALDIEQAHIGGISQGGMISAQFVVNYPERTRSFLLCASTFGNGADEGPGGQWERNLQTGLEIMEGIAQEEGMAALAERRIQAEPERNPHYNEHPIPAEERQRKERERFASMSVAALVGTSRAMRLRPDLSARVREVQVPVLIHMGEWDDFLPCAERDHRLFEGSRYVLARRSGHNTAEWRPDAFVPAVTEFIADVEAGREVAGELVL